MLRVQIDQAALTGESLPAKKFSGDVAFSGSAIKQGERHAVVYATGANTFFGRAAGLIGSTHNVANIQKVHAGSSHVFMSVWWDVDYPACLSRAFSRLCYG